MKIIKSQDKIKVCTSYQGGMSVTDISSNQNLCRATVRTILKDAGVYTGRRSKYSQDFKMEVCRFYDSYSGAATKAKYGICGKSLQDWRDDNGFAHKAVGRPAQSGDGRPSTCMKGKGKPTMSTMTTPQSKGDTLVTNGYLVGNTYYATLLDVKDVVRIGDTIETITVTSTQVVGLVEQKEG